VDYDKILVTGGTGLVGTYLQNEFDGIFISSKDYDLTKEDQVYKMYEEHKPDVVVHLAAKVGGIIDNINKPFEYMEDNVLMNTYVTKYAREFQVKKFIASLSSCIFADVSNRYPLVEEDLHKDLPNESNFGYAYSKRLLGVQVDVARKQGYNFSYFTPSNLYGEYEHGDVSRKHFVGALLDKILQAELNEDNSITLYGDGTPLRQFTFAKDVAEIIYLLIKYDIKENLNLSTPVNMSIDEMARLALQATGNGHLQIWYDVNMPNGQMRKDISIKKFMEIFPNHTFTPYIEGISKTYNTLKKNYGR
jgi:GDP-L-fucose synthase